MVGLHHTNASLFVAGQPESNSHLIRLGVVADGKLTLVSERNKVKELSPNVNKKPVKRGAMNALNFVENLTSIY